MQHKAITNFNFNNQGMLLAALLQITQVGDNSAAVAAATDATQAAPESLSYLDLMFKGGIILVPIIGLSLFAIYLIITKTLEIKAAMAVSDNTISQFKQNLQNGNVEAAATVLSSDPSSFGKIFKPALGRLGNPVNEIESALETATSVEIGKMSKNLSYLSLISKIAPMLGFIGTILGVIKIFYGISINDNISIGIIAEGLYEKMISSGSGLVVGVLAYTGYHLLTMKIDKYIHRIETEAFEFLNIIQGVK